MALAVCHLPLYDCTAALPGSSVSSHFNRTVRSAGGRGAVPVLRRKGVRLSGEGAAGGAAGAELCHLDGGRCVVRCRDDGDAAAEPKKITPQGALAKRPGGL